MLDSRDVDEIWASRRVVKAAHNEAKTRLNKSLAICTTFFY